MNRMIKVVATAMIILSLVMLISVFIMYYYTHENTNTITFFEEPSNGLTQTIPNHDYITSTQQPSTNLVQSIREESGKPEYPVAEPSGDSTLENPTSGDVEPGKNPSENISEPKVVSVQPPESMVISSNEETSNAEKQQVLSEIDQALKGLLDVVGKVETVDEERLDATLEREVEQP